MYSVHPENSDWTCFEQSADLDIRSFFGFEGVAEKVAINEYSKNIAKSKDIMETHIQVGSIALGISVLAIRGFFSPVFDRNRKPVKCRCSMKVTEIR